MVDFLVRYSHNRGGFDYAGSTEYPETQNATCPDYDQYQRIFIHGSVGLAVVIVAVFSFLEKRVNKWPKCCHARPGLVVPINLLDDFRNKWGYAFAFGAITNTIVVLFTEGSNVHFSGPLYSQVLMALLLAVELCDNLFPFFACIATEYKIFGSLVGIFYAALWFSVLLYFTLECLDPVPDVLPYLGLVVQLPTLTCLGALNVWFFITLVITLHKKCKRKSKMDNNPRSHSVAVKWQTKYVKDLLNNDLISEEKKTITCKEKFRRLILKYVFAKRPNFEFSTRIFCTVFVVFMCTYQLGVTYFWYYAKILEWFSEEVYTFLDLIDMPANNTFVNNVEVSTRMLTIGWQTTIAFTLLLFFVDTTAIFFRYRMHMLRLYKGDGSFMPSGLESDPGEVLRSCMLYSGYQVAYMIWGFFVLHFTTWIITLILCFVIILPAMNRNYAILKYIVEAFLVPLVLNFILRLIQKKMAESWFLQPKINPKDKTAPLSIDNRRLFHVMNYFFFFANIATGLFSCLVRIFKGFAFGLVFLGRIDRCVLMRGAEAGDRGYCSYLGMIRVEATHNHPVLRTFCQILLDTVPTAQMYTEAPPGGDDPEIDQFETGRGQATNGRLRRKWWLLYSLLRNPSLIADRRFDIADGDDVTARDIGINVFLSRKRKYDRLKRELQQLEQLLREGSITETEAIKDNGVSNDQQQDGNITRAVSREEIDWSCGGDDNSCPCRAPDVLRGGENICQHL